MKGHPPSAQPRGFAARLTGFQLRYAVPVLAVAALLTGGGVTLATRLEVQTGFEHLLPENRASVAELERVAAKTAGVSTLFIVLQGGPGTPTTALRQAADALVPALEALGAPWVGSAESGVQEAKRFMEPRAGLYADLAKLKKVTKAVRERYEYEVLKVMDALLDEDEDRPANIDRQSMEADLGLTKGARERYPDGYYQSEDGHIVVVAVRSKVVSSDLAQGGEALRRMREVVAQVDPSAYDAGIEVGYAGDLETGVSEYREVTHDLTSVGGLGAGLIIGVVFLFYLRLRAVVAMVLTIGMGVAWSFGFTELVVGHLNVATGFLFTIVAGNGINFSIIYMARFLEARRGGNSLAHALEVAHRETWAPTITAAFAASAAYGSLLVTEFRGFRDFGVIGGAGMIICWLATYLVLPSVLAVIERVAPIAPSVPRPGLWHRVQSLVDSGVAFGRPFALLVARAPRTLFLGGVALALAGIVGLVAYVRSDPMEYDLTKLRNDPSNRSEQIRLTQLAEQITGYVGGDGMAILVDDPADVPLLRERLYALRDAAPQRPFEKLHALQDFVPSDQAKKLKVLRRLKRYLVRCHDRGAIADVDWQEMQSWLPPDDLSPFVMADLPEALARAFTEADGTRGRVVYISPTEGQDINDARYLFRWADAYRETTLADGRLVRGSGRAVIYADMWAAVLKDVPPAVVVSLVATIAVIMLAFRGRAAGLFVLGALLVGVGWMAGLLVLLEVKLNFLNFIALPITFGIGVDYAVNVVQRYVREGAGGALIAVRETGGAVVLCSLTTVLGYVALAGSMNMAVRSLGVAAVLGEITCLGAAVLVLPAGLLWLDGRGRRPGAPESQMPETTAPRASTSGAAGVP